MSKFTKQLKKVGVAIAGVAVIIVGILLIPLPGPGWLVVFAGFVILSTEFEWAERYVTALRKRLDKLRKSTKPKHDDKDSKTKKTNKNSH